MTKRRSGLQRTHEFIVRVTFNRKCSRTFALAAMRDDGDVNAGEHYCDQWETTDPETFKVGRIKLAPKV